MNIAKFRSALIGVAALGMLASGSAHAADSVSVTVNATIIGVCKFFTASPVVNITNTGSGSNIDPSLAASAVGNAAITYRCSNGTTPVFTVPGTATVTCGACSGTPTMTPVITSANTGAGTGLGTGKDQTLTVTGTIVQANFQNAAAGAYTGSMTVDVAP
jgi:hypothetical protein